MNYRSQQKGSSVVELGDVLELVIDHRGLTPLKLGGEWSSKGFRALSAKNIEKGRLKNLESIRFVDINLYKKWMKEPIQRGDILLTSEAPMGEYLFWDSNEKIVLSQRLFGLRANKKLVLPDFLYAYIASPLFQAELQARSSGSTVQGIRQSELMKTKLFLPIIDKQKIIGSFFRFIDQKMDLNRRMNENLAEIGQLLFKQYFLSNPDTKNWKAEPAEKLFKLTMGLSPKGSSYNTKKDGYPLLNGAGDFKNGMLKPDRYTNTPTRVSQIGDIIFCIRGTIGNVTIGYEEYCLGRGVAAMAPIKNASAYVYFSTIRAIDQLTASASGSVIKGLSKSDIANREILLPPADLLEQYEKIVGPCIQKIKIITDENGALAGIRDSLLPRLMSGKISL